MITVCGEVDFRDALRAKAKEDGSAWNTAAFAGIGNGFIVEASASNAKPLPQSSDKRSASCTSFRALDTFNCVASRRVATSNASCLAVQSNSR